MFLSVDIHVMFNVCNTFSSHQKAFHSDHSTQTSHQETNNIHLQQNLSQGEDKLL